MVGIEYTGTNGKTTRFGANSANEAMERLARIPGYTRNAAEDAATGLASGWKSRMSVNRAHVNTPMPTTFRGVPSSSVSVSDGGLAAKTSHVTGMEIRNGKIVQTSRNDYVNESGRIVSVGGERSRVIGSVGETVVREVEKAVESKIGSSASRISLNVKGSNRVITGVFYDTETHQLLQQIGRLVIKDGNSIEIETDGTREVITTAVEETVVS